MDQCFDLAYYGKNTMSLIEAYQLPVNLRSYYYTKLVALREQEAKEKDEANKQANRRSKRGR